jgi:uncharacterized protein
MESPSTESTTQAAAPGSIQAKPAPLNARQRRLLGVLIEKARTTPDAYPLSLTALVTGANQKSNRHPLMNLTSEQVEDELIAMRGLGAVAEVQGSGRVARFRHYGYDYMGVKGAEAAVMTELLLRGEQTAGDLRVRASRFDAIPDLNALNEILRSLMSKELVIALTPSGRGQLITHNLYLPEELDRLKAKYAGVSGDTNEFEGQPAGAEVHASSPRVDETSALRAEIEELRNLVLNLQERVTQLES